MSETGKGLRVVPIMVGLVQFGIAGLILWLTDGGILATIAVGAFALFGLASFRVAFFGSQRLLDQMTANEDLDAETEKEFAKLHGLADDDGS